jgi:hypothetical protein
LTDSGVIQAQTAVVRGKRRPAYSAFRSPSTATAPSELSGKHGGIATRRAAAQFDETFRRRPHLLEQRPQDAILLVLREQTEPTGRQSLGIRKTGGIDVRRAHEAVDAGLQKSELAKHLLVLFGERAEVLLNPVDPLGDRQLLRRRLSPLCKTGPQSLNHAD